MSQPPARPPNGTVPPKPMIHSAITLPRTRSSRSCCSTVDSDVIDREVDEAEAEDDRVRRRRRRAAARTTARKTAKATQPDPGELAASTAGEHGADRQRADHRAEPEARVEQPVGRALRGDAEVVVGDLRHLA